VATKSVEDPETEIKQDQERMKYTEKVGLTI